MTTATLTCPKCRGEMRSYERNGVIVDQCEECRGIFLDRGELEQFLDADTGSRRGGSDHEGHPAGDHHGEHSQGRRQRASSLFEGLLGGGD
jgi:Zn-finger nucleic acid-binding protein